MGNLTEQHRRALDASGKIVAAITPEQWGNRTPCDGWDARALTNHLVAGNLWAAELAAGKTIDQVGTAFDGDVLGDDPASAYQRSAAAAAAAFDAPGALESPCAVSYGPVAGSVYAGHRIIDVFIHGWDLAKATSQADNLDPELVSSCTQIVELQLAALRASGAFGDSAEVPADADGQTLLLIWLGSQPDAKAQKETSAP
jgi:uncharacterized protein (TIGR03086 family)